MDPSTVAVLAVWCFVFSWMINLVVKVLKVGLFSDYPTNAEELPSLPFIGHVYLFIGGNKAILNRVLELGKKYPTSIRLSFGFNSVFFTTLPKHIKEILLSPKTIEKGHFINFARPWMGDGLITAPASIWEVHRKLLQPSFNSIALKSFIKTFSTQSMILAKKLEQHVDGPEFEIHRYISLCTLDTICATTMGINLKAQISEKCQYDEASCKLFAGFAKRAVSPWLYPDFIFYRTQLGKDQKKHIEFMHEFSDDVIRQKKTEIIRRSDQLVSTDEEQDAADDSAAEPQLLIENLLRLSTDNKTLTDEEVRGHIDTIISAGSDTTAITLNYLFLMLASHQDIQDKVYQELCDIFGKHVLDDESEELHITTYTLVRMTYMERVIKETTRLFPPVPINAREATADLDLGDCTLSRGSSVLINVIGVHRSEKYWADPLRFNPDRFLPEKSENHEPFHYLTFSGGRRNCIGSKYATMLMKIIVATILRHYVVTKDKVIPVKDLRLKLDILLRSVDPDTVRIQRRVK